MNSAVSINRDFIWTNHEEAELLSRSIISIIRSKCLFLMPSRSMTIVQRAAQQSTAHSHTSCLIQVSLNELDASQIFVSELKAYNPSKYLKKYNSRNAKLLIMELTPKLESFCQQRGFGPCSEIRLRSVSCSGTSSSSCSGTDLSFAERSVFVPEQVHGPLKMRKLFIFVQEACGVDAEMT
ncbi:CLUMA_CG019798, isoform A [Clunio marinus]|uniref:CLUMA_CG019798, isoform A n=1 Tax=Clunio marinus TaxID=568069 RepID=A0A1J1J2R7_9DIPT|nr:CLUMA_CG019798, isoform A [Clunio marinus]